LGAWAAAACAIFSTGALAVSPDLKVSTDDLNEAGEQFIEFQANKASRPGPNATDPRVPFQFLAEYSYGIADSWQFSLQLPFAREDGARSLGWTAEIRYLPEHDRDAGGYWGIDFEAGRGRELPGEAYSSGVNFRPVLGYRTRRWHFAGNAAFGFPATGDDRRGTFSAALKAAYRLSAKSEAGLEYFLDAGPLRAWHAKHERNEYLFAVWDKIAGNELNIGLGRGLTDASERWILKAVYSFPIFR
jgi:hypothetical protein